MITYITSIKTETNCFLIERNGRGIIVDPINGQAVIDMVSAGNALPDYIVLTHEHVDHIEGLEEVRNHYNIPVVAC